MKSIDKIPVTKIERASKIIQTGAKMGGNYVKYYANRITKTKEEANEILNHDNAEDLYDGLKSLKGSALKMAQMMSMDKGILPKAYVEKFSLAQFSVPPLSGPLIIKSFKKYFGKTPNELFDKFDINAINAASIGQVHLAEKDRKKLAVKVQYPGVADSISSDLALVKPFALKLLNISSADADVYFKEIKDKLIEETDYLNELKQAEEISNLSKHIPNMLFPKYYPKLSCDKVITMDWMTGEHLSEFCEKHAGSAIADKVSQTLWDFYMYQIHVLKKVHADPHPGNFLVDNQGNLIVLDFGCLKFIPDDFYAPYFQLTQKENILNTQKFIQTLTSLEVIMPNDSQKEIDFLVNIFKELLTVFTKPFQQEKFDFSNEDFFNEIIQLGERFAKDKDLRNQNGGRGSKHFIYINRTFFGLYNLMFDLKSKDIVIDNYKKYIID
ncbi:MAG: hypothetical protein RLZZ414_20 [Bacteroidota bacterium]|jgi:predicted unusual protein kinase regulating ubiquinone biosynthesis (AarF/ABC1/UbiB family)